MQFALRGILSRAPSLRIRPISYDIRTHPDHDPGCYLRGHLLVQSQLAQYERALILFDRDGCGQEAKTVQTLEAEVQERLRETGWGDRARAIVLDPELEIWFWSESREVEATLGWPAEASVRDWLEQQDLWRAGEAKPHDPKAALGQAIRRHRKILSSALFEQLASKVSLNKCTDRSFLEFRDQLRQWFPPI